MAAMQHAEGKTNRGAILDGMHMIYTPHVDTILSNDAAFLRLLPRLPSAWAVATARAPVDSLGRHERGASAWRVDSEKRESCSSWPAPIGSARQFRANVISVQTPTAPRVAPCAHSLGRRHDGTLE